MFALSLFAEPTLEKRYDELRSQTFVLYTLGLVALISLIINVLPITSVMLFFLPFYVALIQWKGVGYMEVKPDKVGIFMILAILGVLMPPYIFYFLFSRKLLLNRKEIAKLEKTAKETGFTIIPLRLFINDRGLAKLVIGVARGKKEYDKRQSIKEREDKRAMARIMQK